MQCHIIRAFIFSTHKTRRLISFSFLCSLHKQTTLQIKLEKMNEKTLNDRKELETLADRNKWRVRVVLTLMSCCAHGACVRYAFALHIKFNNLIFFCVSSFLVFLRVHQTIIQNYNNVNVSDVNSKCSRRSCRVVWSPEDIGKTKFYVEQSETDIWTRYEGINFGYSRSSSLFI